MKVCEICGTDIDGKRDGDNRCDDPVCQDAPEVVEETPPKPMTFGAVLATKKQKPRTKQARQRSAMHEAMTGLGLRRVRGALGGVYYE